jgi:hypothetical protein
MDPEFVTAKTSREISQNRVSTACHNIIMVMKITFKNIFLLGDAIPVLQSESIIIHMSGGILGWALPTQTRIVKAYMLICYLVLL